jgi:hypothetical protein
MIMTLRKLLREIFLPSAYRARRRQRAWLVFEGAALKRWLDGQEQGAIEFSPRATEQLKRRLKARAR